MIRFRADQIKRIFIPLDVPIQVLDIKENPSGRSGRRVIPHERLGASKIDFGAEWQAHTVLPFVWAVWAGRPGAIGPDGLAALARSRDEGVAAIDEIPRGYAAGDEDRARRAAEYLRHNVTFGLESPHVEALRRFYGSAAKLGVVDHDLPPRFYGQVT